MKTQSASSVQTMRKRHLVWLVPIIFVAAMTSRVSAAPQVTVYGEGTYTTGEFEVRIYADISELSLLSFALRVLYNPSELSVVGGQKNENVWYFGDGSTRYPYRDPDTSVSGEIWIGGGKLDLANPTAGVTGSRVLLGSVDFTRSSAFLPTFSLALGDNGGFVNFAATDGTIVDDQVGQVVFDNIVFVPRDTDNDGLSDIVEELLGTLIDNPDSDGDGTPDGDEDTDGDGFLNGQEILAESSPANPASTPGTTIVQLEAGFNLVGIPAESLFRPYLVDWINVLQHEVDIEQVQVFDPIVGEFFSFAPGDSSASTYAIGKGQALLVYAAQQGQATFTSVLCAPHDLVEGPNFVAMACPPVGGFSSYDLLIGLGAQNIASVQRYDKQMGRFETAALQGDLPVGVDFPIVRSEGYILHMKQAVADYLP